MPNQLDSVLVSPPEVASGGQTTVSVKYQATQDDKLIVSCSGAYSVSPTSVPLAASPHGATQFALTITRAAAVAPQECMIHFTFHGDERDRIVEVT